jgi:hypothetical protein
MRGYESYNFAAFDEAEDSLIVDGHQPWNPARVDREMGFDAYLLPDNHDWWSLPADLCLEDIAQRDLSALIDCDCIYLLNGWEASAGARAEAAVAYWLRKGFMYQSADTARYGVLLPSETIGDAKPTGDILEEALAITTGDRQAQYGPPDQDFARTATMWQAMFGWDVSPSQVAMAMICLKLSRQTHQAKRDNWVDIAGYARCGYICQQESENAGYFATTHD